ncbi:ATP-binding protein [Persicobacter sp. CCB-QB2]|uniref:ATP-binding protein n=1 Tax=Persicobacter sp. CCB-QB2 TaxID=1561025 RepID=UPI00209F229A|nr:ATP-binding protein [Persicobacter sp. CCB-QB2]
MPGYSTKKRGWGLGLTLTKRIVENYHNGKIFVKSSNPTEGTVFRILLPGKDYLLDAEEADLLISGKTASA